MKSLCWGLVFCCLFSASVKAEDVPSVLSDADSSRIKALHERVDLFRQKEGELQMLHMEVDHLKLEVEKKKAMVELKGASAAGDGAALSLPFDSGKEPVVELKYIVASGEKSHAVIEVDGRERVVAINDELPQGVVKAISADGLLVVSQDGKESRMQVHGY